MVLTPLTQQELTTFFDEIAIEVIHFFLKKSIISQPEKIEGQNDLPIQIPKEHIEQWVVQALGVRPIGAGSYPIDIISDTWGADVKMLSCKVDNDGNLTNADSGETSLAQKFGDGNFGDGNTLDALFASREYAFILDRWKEIIVNKYQRVITDHNIENIYYFIVLRADSQFHLCGIKVNLEELENANVNVTRSTNDSIYVDDFIDNNYGHIKIYKAKKRLELRLKPKYWVDNNRVITFNTNFEQINANIREKIENNQLEDYINETLIPILLPEEN